MMNLLMWLDHVLLHTWARPVNTFRDMNKSACNNCWRVKVRFY